MLPIRNMEYSNKTTDFNDSLDSTPEKMNTFSELFEPENLRHSWPWIIFFFVLYTIVFVVGIVGNFLVILVYYRNSQTRSVRDLFIMNLAVADLLVILFCVPGNLVANTFVPWILGPFMCKSLAYVQGVSVFASAYFLAAISVDRFLAFYRPMQIAQGLTKTQAVVTITLIWTIAFLLLIPWAVVFEVTTSNENDPTLFCIETWEDEKDGNRFFLFGNFLCCYVLPVVLICICNFHLLCIVKRRKVKIDSVASSKTVENVHRKQNSNVTKTLFFLTFTFILSWLPLYVIICRLKFFDDESISETEHYTLSVLLPFAQLLGSSNSCINPIFYAFLNSKFRGMLKSIFKTSCVFKCHLNTKYFPGNKRYQSRRKRTFRSSSKTSTKTRTTKSTQMQSAYSSISKPKQVVNQQHDMFKIISERSTLKRETSFVQMYVEVCESERLSKFSRETRV